MLSKFKKNNQGFTLIEMIVSLAVFAIVVTTAVGALLILISTNQQLQGEQNVMTNLSFALDTMTREIRTGYNYYCADSTANSAVFDPFGDQDILLGEDTKDCVDGRTTVLQGISFYEGGNSITGDDNRILYYYDFDEKTIYRRVGNGASEPIVSSALIIDDMQFYVTGTDKLDGPGDVDQPSVTIYIVASEKGSSESKPYYLQTTVTQRILDL